MDYGIYAGDTDKTIYLRLRDSTTGLAKTGLAYNSAGAVCSYVLPRAARAAITLATQTVTGSHSDGGFVEVDATNCKGLYRLDLPDAAIASGDYTIISIEFDGIIEESVQIPLHTRKVNTIQVGGTTQTARDIGASVLLSPGTGTGQILLSNGKVDAYAINGETQTAVDIGGALVQLIPQFGNAVGATGNTTTTIHLSGIATYDNDEIVDHLLIIFDGSTGESHSRWITAFNGTTDVATVATLPFTPQATVDLWTLTNIRRNTKPESLGTQAKADVNAEADQALSDYDPPTRTEATADKDAIIAQGDSAWLTATGFSTHSAEDVRTEMDANSTKLANIEADTNELQGDWADGGRLDAILDARASQASVDDVPTNSELATALAAADDAVLAAIAALNNLSAAQVNAQVLDVIATDTLIDGKTLQQAIRYIAALVAGKVSGAGTGTETFVGIDGSTNRATVTVDSSGNRTAVSYDP